MAHVGGNSSRHRLETDTPLNIVSIIDCLTVLIIYLLAAASFVSMSSLDSTIGNSGKGVGGSAVVPVVMVELKESRDIVVSVLPPQALQADVSTIPAREGGWDFPAVTKALEGAKGSFPSIDSVILVSDPKVGYGLVVRAADRLRATLPVVLGVGDSL